MTDQLTATVTFTELRAQYDEELARARDAYHDLVSVATDDYGDDAITAPPVDDTHATLQQQIEALNQTGKTIQTRQHAIKSLAERYDGNSFTVAMLSGRDVADIETQLRMNASGEDAPDTLAVQRRGLVVDAATVDAPEGFPTDDDESPKPSDAPNPITVALYEYVQSLTQAGDADFSAPGFGDTDPSRRFAHSPAPTSADASPSDSGEIETPTPEDGSG